jgi:hypothetical protein
MKNLINKINNYILYDPNLLTYLKKDGGKPIQQLLVAAGHTIEFTVGLFFIVPVGILDQWLHLIHIDRGLGFVLLFTSITSLFWFTYCIAKEHKIFGGIKDRRALVDVARYMLNTIDYYLFYHPTILKRFKYWENPIAIFLVFLWHAGLFTLMPCLLISIPSVIFDFLVPPLFYLLMLFLWLVLTSIITYKYSKPDFNPEKYK